MKTKIITLNNKDEGFAICSNATNDFIRNKKKETIIFHNLESAKAFAFKRISKAESGYKIWIITKEIVIPMDHVEYVSPYYEYYDANNHLWYLIEEENYEQVLDIGYFVFGDGDNPEANTRFSKEKSSQLFYSLNRCMEHFINNTESSVTAERFTKISYGHVVMKLIGTTVKIHLMFNSEILDKNVRRKEAGLRCIPFIKDMDRYKTFYMYITKNVNDYTVPDDFSFQEQIDAIVEIMNNVYPDINCKYVPVKFYGFIKTSEGE